jgi:hypothetical protein
LTSNALASGDSLWSSGGMASGSATVRRGQTLHLAENSI